MTSFLFDLGSIVRVVPSPDATIFPTNQQHDEQSEMPWVITTPNIHVPGQCVLAYDDGRETERGVRMAQALEHMATLNGERLPFWSLAYHPWPHLPLTDFPTPERICEGLRRLEIHGPTLLFEYNTVKRELGDGVFAPDEWGALFGQSDLFTG